MVNLWNVKHLIEEYEENVRLRQEASAKKKQEPVEKKRDKKKNTLEHIEAKGSFEKGDVVNRIEGLRKSKTNGQVLCLCSWKKRKGDRGTPSPTYVPMSTVKLYDPEALLDYFEWAGRMYRDYSCAYPRYTGENALHKQPQ